MTRRKVIGAVLAAVSVAAAAFALALVIITGHNPGPGSEPLGPMRCTITDQVDTNGPTPATARERVERRIKRFCDAMGATTPAAPAAQSQTVQRVNARRFCLELAEQGHPIPGIDCDQIPTDAVYYHH